MWAHKRAVAAASAVVTVAGLAVGLFLILRPGPPAARPALAVRPRLLSPLTGEPVASLGPVIAVKVDNIAQARPHTGLSRADIVYVLPVEGGLSRFLAVFSSHFPPLIGPVRLSGKGRRAHFTLSVAQTQCKLGQTRIVTAR